MRPKSRRNDLAYKRAKDRFLGEKIAARPSAKEQRGRPLNIHRTNFSIPLTKRIQSYIGGPEFALRARKVELQVAELIIRLEDEYQGLKSRYRNAPDTFAGKWTAFVDGLELDDLNRLIDKHNRYYPQEANLRTNPETGEYMIGAIPWEKQPRMTREELLRRFPIEAP